MMMAKDVEHFRQEFLLEKPTHIPLNNAGLGMIPRATQTKMNEMVSYNAANGVFAWQHFFEHWLDAKKTLASFIGAKESEVTWTTSCSEAISFVANGYKASAGEEIVIFENDYPANFYPWVDRARRLGSKLNIVKCEKDLTRPLEKVVAQITNKTKIVALSHIQSDCGYLLDISEVAAAAHKVGAILVVDVIQSAGVCPLNFEKSGADVFCGGNQKWLCGLMGAGFLVVKESLLDSISPSLHGALNYGQFDEQPKIEKNYFKDIRKFEQGTPSMYSLIGSAQSMKVLADYSVDNLWKKSQSLRSLLKSNLKDLGFTIYGGESTGPQISVSHMKIESKKISEALLKEKISHTLRPVPIEGGKVLRLSPHAYNTQEEISFVIEVIKKAIG
jgi:cysteine desulfurase/selenocysteine lyase